MFRVAVVFHALAFAVCLLFHLRAPGRPCVCGVLSIASTSSLRTRRETINPIINANRNVLHGTPRCSLWYPHHALFKVVPIPVIVYSQCIRLTPVTRSQLFDLDELLVPEAENKTCVLKSLLPEVFSSFFPAVSILFRGKCNRQRMHTALNIGRCHVSGSRVLCARWYQGEIKRRLLMCDTSRRGAPYLFS